jgi:hypothetical protein
MARAFQLINRSDIRVQSYPKTKGDFCLQNGRCPYTDDAYLDNPFFQIIDGRPKLGRVKKKAIPEGFQELDAALTKKLDKLELSLLDVLADTS